MRRHLGPATSSASQRALTIASLPSKMMADAEECRRNSRSVFLLGIVYSRSNHSTGNCADGGEDRDNPIHKATGGDDEILDVLNGELVFGVSGRAEADEELRPGSAPSR